MKNTDLKDMINKLYNQDMDIRKKLNREFRYDYLLRNYTVLEDYREYLTLVFNNETDIKVIEEKLKTAYDKLNDYNVDSCWLDNQNNVLTNVELFSRWLEYFINERDYLTVLNELINYSMKTKEKEKNKED